MFCVLISWHSFLAGYWYLSVNSAWYQLDADWARLGFRVYINLILDYAIKFFRIFVIYSRIRWRWFYSISLFVSSAGGEDDVDSILIAISKDRWSFRAPFVLLVIVRDALIVRMDPPRHNTNASFSKPDKSSTFFLKDSYDYIIIMTPEIWWPW